MTGKLDYRAPPEPHSDYGLQLNMTAVERLKLIAVLRCGRYIGDLESLKVGNALLDLLGVTP